MKSSSLALKQTDYRNTEIEVDFAGLYLSQHKLIRSYLVETVGVKRMHPSKNKTSEKIKSIENHSDGRVSSDLACCLTTREKEILIHVATGAGNREIATTLKIRHNTVKTHIYNIFKKINVTNRLQAALWTAKYI